MINWHEWSRLYIFYHIRIFLFVIPNHRHIQITISSSRKDMNILFRKINEFIKNYDGCEYLSLIPYLMYINQDALKQNEKMFDEIKC